MRIGNDEEFSKDWDWFAADLEDHIGHFTSAGMRRLPRSVKDNASAAELVANFFGTVAPKSSTYFIRDDVEADAGGWKTEGARDWYLKSFAEMASKGMFSYNTQLGYSPDTKYYLVATPDRPLLLVELPPEIRKIVARTRAPISFQRTNDLPEDETLDW
jgi:hypothetical protein